MVAINRTLKTRTSPSRSKGEVKCCGGLGKEETKAPGRVSAGVLTFNNSSADWRWLLKNLKMALPNPPNRFDKISLIPGSRNLTSWHLGLAVSLLEQLYWGRGNQGRPVQGC
jgi:hypothetical protein